MRALGVEAWGVPADLARVSEAHRLAEATLSWSLGWTSSSTMPA